MPSRFPIGCSSTDLARRSKQRSSHTTRRARNSSINPQDDEVRRHRGADARAYGGFLAMAFPYQSIPVGTIQKISHSTWKSDADQAAMMTCPILGAFPSPALALLHMSQTFPWRPPHGPKQTVRFPVPASIASHRECVELEYCVWSWSERYQTRTATKTATKFGLR